MTTRSWLADLEFSPGTVRVRKTGAVLAVNAALVRDVTTWMAYFLAIRAEPRAPGAVKVHCVPDRPRPWYLLWPVLRLAGARMVTSAADAEIMIGFEDRTRCTPGPAGTPGLNLNCVDVSKSRVAEAFAQAFGYPLALDPRSHHGPAVEKSEENGVHDGRIVACPCEPRAGRAYQRLVDAEQPDGLVEDLRTPTIGGVPQLVFVKRRTRERRFANDNVEVRLRRVETVFTADEIAAIGRFCAAMGLDWGGLDILRDRTTRRLYVVDANKTDMGPPVALPLREKLEATRLLAAGLRRHLDALLARACTP
jgi:hypothetical protein